MNPIVENSIPKSAIAIFFLLISYKSYVIEAFNQNLAVSQKSTSNVPFVFVTSSKRLTICNSKAGSFFHPVPSDPDDDSDSSKNNESAENDEPSIINDAFDFDRNLNDMLKKRSTSIASKPSTIDGVPTSKAKGFGETSVKKSKPTPATKPFVGIGKPDKPLNDINNPEFDDQGYTLYTDEETGEKKACI